MKLIMPYRNPNFRLWDLVEAALSPYEITIAHYLLSGVRSPEIAQVLKTGRHAINGVIRNIFNRFGLDPCKVKDIAVTVELYKYSWKL